ncbi:pentapeptide repeat-containing protein [Micromonospora sp. NPDC047793]|uniref:pentapeptide repeat-containing protein n=1 Tax=Micromonospora sp. NPDC047793 TaxID=3154342 RepID=UPI0033C8C05B
MAYEVITLLLASSNPGQEMTPSGQLEILKTALTATAGVGAGTGLYVAYRKQRVEEVNAVREQGKVYAERFQNAIKDLGSDSDIVRGSALSLLTGLAGDWRSGRQTCVDALCAYLRRAKREGLLAGDDHQAALTRVLESVRGRYGSGGWEGSSINLLGSSLPSANLTNIRLNEVNFDNCIFEGAAEFDHAIFFGRVSFRGAIFHEVASFTGATFLDACDFTEAVFLQGANFHGAIFEQRCLFREVAFSLVRKPLLNCSTRFTRSTFMGSVDFTDVSMEVDVKSSHYLQYLMLNKTVFLDEVAVSEDSFTIEWLGSEPGVQRLGLNEERNLILEALRSNLDWRRPHLLAAAISRFVAIIPRLAKAHAAEHSSRI